MFHQCLPVFAKSLLSETKTWNTPNTSCAASGSAKATPNLSGRRGVNIPPGRIVVARWDNLVEPSGTELSGTNWNQVELSGTKWN